MGISIHLPALACMDIRSGCNAHGSQGVKRWRHRIAHRIGPHLKEMDPDPGVASSYTLEHHQQGHPEYCCAYMLVEMMLCAA